MKTSESNFNKYMVCLSLAGILCSFAVEFELKPPPCFLLYLLSHIHIHSVQVELSSGNNVLYWRTTAYTLEGSAAKPVLIKNIAISGRL